jgi:arsenate reductase
MATAYVIYHNPKCSTSRQVLQKLRDHGVEPQVVEYLKTPLDAGGLRDLVKKLGVEPREIVRTKETIWKDLAVDPADADAVISAIVSHPVLMQRPIVVHGKRAVVGRPQEAVESLLEG